MTSSSSPAQVEDMTDGIWKNLAVDLPGLTVLHPLLPLRVSNLIQLLGTPLALKIGDFLVSIPTPEIKWTADLLKAFSLAPPQIVCGKPSNGLVAIEFDDASLLNQFIALNPLLKTSLLTYKPGFYYVWMRFKGEPVGSFSLLCSKFHGKNSVEIFDEQPMTARTLASPVITELSAIKWLPADEHEIIDRKRQWAYGPAFRKGRPNSFYWAARFSHERGIVYDPQQRIYCRVVENAVRPISENSLGDMLFLYIKSYAELVEKPVLLDLLISLNRFAKLIRALQAVAVFHSSGEETVYEDFLKKACEPSKGVTTTISEIWSAYVEFSNRIAPGTFIPNLAPKTAGMIYRAFGTSVSNSIKRNGKARSGFRGLALKRPTTGAPANADSENGRSEEETTAPESSLG